MADRKRKEVPTNYTRRHVETARKQDKAAPKLDKERPDGKREV